VSAFFQATSLSDAAVRPVAVVTQTVGSHMKLRVFVLGGTIVALGAYGVHSATSQAARFSASPTSGNVPLTVAFCADAGIVIEFGDGARSGMGEAPSGACPAGRASYVTHTYTIPGTYQLRATPCPPRGNAVCGEVAQAANAVTITATSGR
jgi:PKD repeat protein